MPTNVYFQSGVPGGRTSEQRVLESLIIECLKIYGFDCYYIPRKLVKEDELFGEDILSKFEFAIPLEMYIKNVNGFGGEGDFVSKFGIEIRDQATFVVARMRWDEAIARKGIGILPNRPSEGDLIYFPSTSSLFEIKFVETQNPFYQLGKLYTYDLQCELFTYSSERLDTGILEVDEIGVLQSIDMGTYNILLEDGEKMIFETGTGGLVLDDFIVDDIQPAANNESIRLESEEIMDWTEVNPFGEVRK